MASSWFDDSYYLSAKAAYNNANAINGITTWTVASVQASLNAAGMTAEQHYSQYGWTEGLAPNAYYVESQYVASKVAALNAGAVGGKTDWTSSDFYASLNGTNPFMHYVQYGAYETGVEPSTGFNDDTYYADKAAYNNAHSVGGITTWTADTVKAAFQAAGLTPIGHYELYGATENFYTPTPNPVAGQTYTLTTNIDVIPGTAGDDTVLGTNTTLTPGDNINGAGGTNQMQLIVSGGTASTGLLEAATIDNIQNYYITDVNTSGGTIAGSTASVYGFAAAGGEAKVYAKNSTAEMTVTGLAAGTTIGMIGNGAVTNAALAATYATGATATAIDIQGDVLGAPTIAVTNATGITSATITSSGATTTAGAVLGGIALAGGNTVTSLTIDAASKLTTGAISGFTTASPTTMTVTGAGAVNVGTLAATLDTVDATTNTGGLTATLSSATAAVTGGSGNDNISTGGILLSTGSVNAGTGTADRLTVSNTADVATTTLGGKYSNFEVLSVGAGVTADVDNLSANNTFTAARYADGGTINNMNATMAGAVTAVASGTYVFGVKGATTPGQTDTLGITASDGASTTSTIALGTPTAAGVENININAVDNVTIAGLTNATSLSSMTLTGTGTIGITSGALAVNANTAINGSAATGAQTIDFSAATTRGVGITTGSANDLIAGTAVASMSDTLNGGAGNDTIIGDANAEVQTLLIGTSNVGNTATVVVGGVTLAAIAQSDTETVTATNIANAINGNATLIAAGITAATGGTATVTITSAATNGNIAEVTYASSGAGDVVTAGTTTQGALNVAGDILTGSTGNDTFFISAGAGNTIANADTITDLNFGGSTLTDNADTLKLMATGALAGTNATIATLTSAEQSAVSAAADLSAATDLVMSYTGVAGTATTFTYGSDTFLAVNVDADATYTATADYLTKITGFTGTLSSSDISFIG